MMPYIFGGVLGAGIAVGATQLPNWWWLFPVRWLMFGAGLLILGNSLFACVLQQSNSVVP